MNILFINNSDISGGAAKVAFLLKEKIIARGGKVSMFVKYKYSNDPDVYLMRWYSPLTKIIKKLTGKDVGSYLSSKLHRLLATDINWFNTDQILKTEQFKNADLVHCHNLHGNYFKLDTLRKITEKKPVIWTFHDMWPITAHCAHAYGGSLKEGFYGCPSLNTYQDLLWDNQKHLLEEKRRVYKNSQFHIVVPCKWLGEKVKESILRNHPISVIYNGIDNTIFSPQKKTNLREKLNLPQNKKIVLFVSNIGIDKEKGGDFLKAATNILKEKENILFLCIGRSKNQISFKQQNLRYIPYIEDQRLLSAYYATSDVFIFSSLAETFPLVVLEAMSAGLPIVSFDVGGVKEAVIHKKSGYISKYKDVNDLVKGVEYILSLSKENYLIMSREARKSVEENFTLEIMTKSYFSLYKALLSDKNDNC